MDTAPGRTCPLSYRYRPEDVLAGPRLKADTVWIAGGLYGNTYALDCLLDAFAAEPGEKALVFNGDFHWFDADAGDFARVSETVMSFRATRGNVETELAGPAQGAGCGCAYPEWVDQKSVDRSNRIIERLRGAAARHAGALAPLAALPMHLAAKVGDARIAIVHGDLESLAGWGFSQEALRTPAGTAAAEAMLERSGAHIVASSHTCLPVLQQFTGGAVLANNGAAGMPNFRGERYGLATRISVRPHAEAIHRRQKGRVYIEAMALRYDQSAWQRRFLELWPAGSDAHLSYWGRIANGP